MSGAALPAPPALGEVQSLVGLDRATLLARLQAAPTELHRADYGPSTDMEAIRARPPVAGTVFLQEGRVVLVSLFRGLKPPPEPTVFGALSSEALAAAFPNAEPLRSRSGKEFNHFVDADAGVAWSAGEGRVTFLEVFAPTDLDTYRQRFYQDPGVLYK